MMQNNCPIRDMAQYHIIWVRDVRDEGKKVRRLFDEIRKETCCIVKEYRRARITYCVVIESGMQALSD